MSSRLRQHGAPVQDWWERGSGCAEEPGEPSVDGGEGDGHSGECFAQVFQPVDFGQGVQGCAVPTAAWRSTAAFAATKRSAGVRTQA
ncbi:hypothetical protein [Streptomyces subrutilus]|uniref:Uncharacterized protein n=1 Tax=Streptomyces subrutilus TaxID=36818 RepID=A0A1E5PKN3_9ACTN|nr:hypothetical protein [Streptomyces subrutilus]OEJ30084.1 hypothetical protein BGK67_00685 [Streptomyces subrutilus]